MRPKKNRDLRNTSINIRLTASEDAVFRAQAEYRQKGLSEYLRDLARQDGQELHAQEKIRQDQEGNWEVLLLGQWKKVT